MKITKRQLRRIIKEEKASLIREYSSAPTINELVTDIADVIRTLGDIAQVNEDAQTETPAMGGPDIDQQEEVGIAVREAIENLNVAMSALASPRR